MTKNIEKGKLGEEIATDFLRKKGYKILHRNWRYSRCGEIDIIASDRDTLVFIEVKARSSLNFGHPSESINKNKIDKIRKLAGIYLSENKENKFHKFRFDAVGVILGSKPEIFYYKDIYQF
jgi:putative endonuclease